MLPIDRAALFDDRPIASPRTDRVTVTGELMFQSAIISVVEVTF